MSKAYGGLGYFDLNIDNLGARFLFISRHWDLPSPPGIVLRHCYETFRLSVGLGGDIFELDYDSLEKLAEHSWFKHLWLLCHMISSPIIFNTKYKIPQMRKKDRPIMDVFRDSGIWQMKQLLVLQCMRRYKCVYALSDTLECDGRTVMLSMMDNSEGTSEWTFPKEKPRRKDFELWCTALLHVTSSIQTSFGPYIRHPHKNTGWYTSSDNLYLYKQNPNGTFDSFRQSPSARTTIRRKYIPCLTSYSPPLDTKTSKYALGTIQEGMTDIIITSTTSCFIPDEHP